MPVVEYPVFYLFQVIVFVSLYNRYVSSSKAQTAIFLNQMALPGTINNVLYLVQVMELLAGATNLFLIGLNIRDGCKFVVQIPNPESISPKE